MRGLDPSAMANIGLGSPNGRQSSLTEAVLAIDVPNAPCENWLAFPWLSSRSATVRDFVQCRKIGQLHRWRAKRWRPHGTRLRTALLRLRSDRIVLQPVI